MTTAWPAVKVSGVSCRSSVRSTERGVAGAALAIGTVTNGGKTLPSCHNALVARGRRIRGVLLRLVLNRPLAIGVGVALVVPAVYLFVVDVSWESGVSDGVSLVALATGAALIWTGMSGRRADWIDPD